ncbi:hypothetical protein ACTJKE_06465 [Ensifer sp. 22521]
MQMKKQTLILHLADIDVYSEEQTFDDLAEQFPEDPFFFSEHFGKPGGPIPTLSRTK